MLLIDRESLTATVDAVNEALFLGRSLSTSERREAASAIAARQGKAGSYGNMFAPTRLDAGKSLRLFTGETVPPGVGAFHILGEEALRALILLDVPSKEISGAVARASEGILSHAAGVREVKRIAPVPGPRNLPGMFCCPKCTCAAWRHLAVRNTQTFEKFLAMGVNALRAHRDGKGRWMAWSFPYTLLALIDIDLPGARTEMRYAAKECEVELAKRSSKSNAYSRRRRLLMERILAKC